MFVETVFEKEVKFIKEIHLSCDSKLSELLSINELSNVNFGNLNDLELLTTYFMKRAKKSDRNFLLWMCAVGSYIKMNFNGQWALINYHNNFFNKYVPVVINQNNDIWEVGNFCYKYYYNERRMYGIGFGVFYKINIERAIWKPKYTDLNISEERFTFLER